MAKLNLNLFDDESIEENNNQNQTPNNQLEKFKTSIQGNDPKISSFISNAIPKSNNENKKKLLRNIDNFKNNKELDIKIFGIGGAGNNMVNHMAHFSNIEQEWLYAFNTDFKVLKNLPEDINVVLIGNNITNGHGSGSDPEIGMKAALEDLDTIKEALEGTDVLFIVSGMGKGTGTGASPIVAKAAQEMGILTLSIVNLPSITNEGPEIYKKGQFGLKNLSKVTNGILTISNEKLFKETSESITLQNAFGYADYVISQVIYEIITLINVASVINVDFNDVKTFFKEPTSFQVNTFEFKNMENIENEIASQLSSQIYQDDISKARKVIVNYKLNPFVSRDFVNKFAQALANISKKTNLDITYAVDYFDGIDFALVTTLIAKEPINEFLENLDNIDKPEPNIISNDQEILEEKEIVFRPRVPQQPDVAAQTPPPPIKPVIPNPIDQIEIINTKTEELEAKSQTINIPTREQVMSNRFSSSIESMKSVFSDYGELCEKIDFATNNDVHVNNDQEALVNTRRNFIPTKKLVDHDETSKSHRTIRFSHPTGEHK